MTLTHITTTSKPRIHLGEYRQVQTSHLPDFARRFACQDELQREGQIIKAKYPHLSEEVDLIIAQELQRRSLALMQVTR